jgi:hypothetical protein
MLTLTPEQTIDYLRRSYSSVDGLWFVKLEERDGFEKALDLDEKVWQVMPKIQARKLKSFAGVGTGIDALRHCFETKLSLDGFIFTVTAQERAFEVLISFCPWHDRLVKSKREHLADRIGSRICTAEYGGWASEFGCSFSFSGDSRICRGCKTCGLHFEEGGRRTG